MRTRTLGPLEVSVVGLGCNNFGRRIDAEGTKAVVDAALEAGVTFFDTADVYGNRGGSESILGEVLQGRRDQVVLATKWGAMLDFDEQPHGTRGFVRSAIDASLERLQTDHVDLYQHHQEDKRTPLEETFAALKELVVEGKVLAVGTSNYEPDTLEEAALLAKDFGLPYVSEQSEYSWLKRDAEAELLPTCDRLGLARAAARRGDAAARKRARGREARPRRALPRLGRGSSRLTARRRDRRPGRRLAGRVGDRRRDEARAGARERRRRRLGAVPGRARRATGALADAGRFPVGGDPDPPGSLEELLRHERAQPLEVSGEERALLGLERLLPLLAAHTRVAADRPRVVAAHRGHPPKTLLGRRDRRAVTARQSVLQRAVVDAERAIELTARADRSTEQPRSHRRAFAGEAALVAHLERPQEARLGRGQITTVMRDVADGEESVRNTAAVRRVALPRLERAIRVRGGDVEVTERDPKVAEVREKCLDGAFV